MCAGVWVCGCVGVWVCGRVMPRFALKRKCQRFREGGLCMRARACAPCACGSKRGVRYAIRSLSYTHTRTRARARARTHTDPIVEGGARLKWLSILYGFHLFIVVLELVPNLSVERVMCGCVYVCFLFLLALIFFMVGFRAVLT